MAPKHKHGATFKLILDQFSETEWEAIYPFDEIEADIGQGANRFDTVVTTDVENRSLVITAETRNLKIGPAELDIRIIKDGQTIIIPSNGTIKLSIVRTITE